MSTLKSLQHVCSVLLIQKGVSFPFHRVLTIIFSTVDLEGTWYWAEVLLTHLNT
jgi:hypothetical protein